MLSHKKKGAFHHILKNVILCSIALLAIKHNALAGYQTRNWDVDGLNGGVFASGSLVSAPCILAPESAEQEIDLGFTNHLSFVKDRANYSMMPVEIVLNDCPGAAVTLRDASQNQGATWLSEQPAVRMVVNGQSDPHDKRLFKLNGNVSGVALRIEDDDGVLVMPGNISRPHPLTPGRNSLRLNAQLERTGQTLELGEWSSLLSVDLEYE